MPRANPHRLAALVALSSLALGACRDATPEAPDAERPLDIGPADTGPPLPPTREGRIAARFRGCRGVETGCHDSANPAGLVLGRTPAEDFAQLVNVRSTERPDLFRAEPGAPDRSWIVLKLDGNRDAGVETPMPLGSTGDHAFAAEVRAWILDGAPDPFADAGAD